MRATRPVAAVVAVTGLLSLNIVGAAAYQVPTALFDEATTVMPGSGLRQTITVTGRTELGDPSTAGFRGSAPTTYQPAIAPSTPTQDVIVNTGDCAPTGGCGDRGTVTIAFAQPVRNPVLHVSGIGGSISRTVSGKPTAQSELHTILELTTAGLSLTKLGAGNNLAVTSDTITAANQDAGPNCVNTKTGAGLDATATAACGSVRVNGIVSRVSFAVSAFFTKHPKLPPLNTTTSGDVFSVVASTPEDFGDAPATYGAAWSVLSDLHLGPDLTEDNADVANGTSGPTAQDRGDDGVVFAPLRSRATTYSANLQLAGASKAGRACAWIDLDGNGTFAASERVCAPFAARQTTVTLRWSALAPKAGATWARVRVGYDDAQVEKPVGAADAGEVEDYPFAITPPPPPMLTDDTVSTAFNTDTVVNVLGNDKAGDPATPLKPSTLCLIHDSECVEMVNVVGEAKYVARADGTVRIEPIPGFVGPAAPVTYRVADANGTTATAKLTLTVALPDRPVAKPDTATTAQNVSVSVKPLANDQAADGVQFVPGSVVLRDPADRKLQKQVAIAGEGSYVVKPDGGVDFVPAAQFTGVGTSIGYRVSDTTGQTAESTLAVTVTPVTPIANGDSVSTAFDTDIVVPVLANDVPGSPGAPFNPATLRLVDPATHKLVDKLTIPRQGTYLISSGKVTFQPVHGFHGVATTLTYQVVDLNGTPARATLTISVDAPGPPIANPDTITTLQGRPILIPVLANDKPGPTGAAIVPAGLELIAPPAEVDVAGGDVMVPGQGKYRTSDGQVVFEPVPGFSGTATPIGYQVADSNGTVGQSTLTVQVTKVVPDAADDTAATAYDTPVTVDVLANDEAGDPAVVLVPGSVRLIDPKTSRPVDTVVTAQAAYAVVPDGKVSVDPVPGFAGTTSPVGYQVSDVNGTVATAQLTVTVAKPAPPTAKPDTATGKQNVTLTLSPLVNDLVGVGTTVAPLSLDLLDPANGSVQKLVTIPGEAAYQVNANGTVTVDPLPVFTGTATKVTYQVADRFGQTARSTITVTITPITPVATDDVAKTPYDKNVKLSVLANDRPGDPTAPLVPGSLRLIDPADGLPKASVAIRNEGAYTAAGGVVTFDPAATFRGPGTPISYQVADSNGTVTTAKLAVTVGRPPVAIADSASTLQNVTVTVNVISNDSPGTDAKLDRSSVELLDPAARSAGYVKEVTVASQGTYSVGVTGSVTFDPVPSFRGRATSITYRVADSDGNSAASTLTMTVTPICPVAIDDSAMTPYGHAITLDVLANDKPGDPSAPLAVPSLVLKDASGHYAKTLTRAGEGTYRAGTDGKVTFIPVKGFHGMAKPATYRISDDNGSTAEGLLLLTVGKGPSAVTDAVTTKQNVTLTIDPLVNDEAGTGAQLDKTSLQVFATPSALESWGRKAEIPGQGVFAVDTASGKISFDPASAFRGVVSIAYQVTDTAGNKAAAAIAVTVSPVNPVVVDDRATTQYATAVTVDVRANDKPGDPSAPLGGVHLVDPATGNPVASLVTTGEGTFTVQPSGAVRFAPADGFVGAATPVEYEVVDRNGTVGTGTLTIVVQDRPVATPDEARTKQHVAVVIDPLANDKPGPGGTLDPKSLLLVGPDGALVDQVAVAGQGAYVVAEGKVMFSPVTTFVGRARPVGYEVKDSNGNSARATITVGVAPVRPVTLDDSASTAYGTAVVVKVLANDKPGDASAPLRPESVVLRDPVDGAEKKTVKVGEGSFAVAPDGTVTFTPVATFIGTTRSLAYRVSDANGTSNTALLTVTVAGPLLTKATPLAATGSRGNPVVVNPVPDGGRTKVCLRTSTTCAQRLTNGSGTWTVAADGTITLQPVAGFTGKTRQVYESTDGTGRITTAPVSVTIGAQPPALRPTAVRTEPTGGPPLILLTLGILLAALGATIATIARSRR